MPAREHPSGHGCRGTRQCSVRSIFIPSRGTVARAAGHAQPTAPAARPGVIPLPFAARDRHPPSASLSELGQCNFHSEFSPSFIEQKEIHLQKQKDKGKRH